MRRRTKVLLGMALAAAVGVAACFVLLPDRFRVNAPIGHLLFGQGIRPPAAVVLARLQAPPGFTIGRFADDLPNVRFLRFTPSGRLLVTLPRSGQVMLLEPDRNRDGRSDGRSELIGGLNRPHGLDLHAGFLYVAETDAVGRIRFDPATGTTTGAFERIVTGLPAGGNHWTRTLRFGPDGWMYVSIGSSCNVCREEDPRRATLMRFRPDGSGGEVFATGLRNAVGFDWRPGTGELFATDNGRDLLGDGFPPCELDRVEPGRFYGWPIANGDRVPDPDFGTGEEARIAASMPPAHAFGAHNAPLGITFVRSESAPTEYRGAALVALHGSWNRTTKAGYKVVSLHWDDAGRISERDFLTGFEKDEDVIGRPVDVAEGPDGAFYVSDDYAGSILRVSHGPGSPRAAAVDRSAPEARPRVRSVGPEAEATARRGRASFERHHCGDCHDPAKAVPGMVTRRLAGLSARYTPATLDAYLKTPTPPMPAVDLPGPERSDLVFYLLGAYP